MAGVLLSEGAARKTADAVRHVLQDRQLTRRRAPQNPTAPFPLLAFADENIDVGSTGTVLLASGAAANEVESTVTREATNVTTMRVFNGAPCLITWLANIDSGGNWQIIANYSAMRLKGTSPAGGIASGATGTLTSVQSLGGTLPLGSIVARNWTANFAVPASVSVRAEWDDHLHQWTIYASDCPVP